MKQETHYCGPASVASVMAYYGSAIDQHAVAQSVYSQKLGGALITDLENYARSHGFQAGSKTGTIQDIRDLVKQKKPVIVLVDLGFWFFSQPHYLVVTGFDENGFTAHTGYEESKPFPYGYFQKIWSKKGSACLVIWR